MGLDRTAVFMSDATKQHVNFSAKHQIFKDFLHVEGPVEDLHLSVIFFSDESDSITSKNTPTNPTDEEKLKAQPHKML